MKSIIKCWEDFLWYSTSLKTYRAAGKRVLAAEAKRKKQEKKTIRTYKGLIVKCLNLYHLVASSIGLEISHLKEDHDLNQLKFQTPFYFVKVIAQSVCKFIMLINTLTSLCIGV